MSWFQAGQANVAVVSSALAVGISLHAEQRSPRTRELYLLELPGCPVTAVQVLGRCHRSGQVCPPAVVVCSSTRNASVRFSAIVQGVDDLGLPLKLQLKRRFSAERV